VVSGFTRRAMHLDAGEGLHCYQIRSGTIRTIRHLPISLRSDPDRRDLLRVAGIGLGIIAASSMFPSRILAALKFKTDPFSLGVASGDPAQDGFVIWTRLAPAPLEAGGGMPLRAVDVTWEIAADEAMTRRLRAGVATARPDLSHAVHVEGALEPRAIAIATTISPSPPAPATAAARAPPAMPAMGRREQAPEGQVASSRPCVPSKNLRSAAAGSCGSPARVDRRHPSFPSRLRQ
jgi:hypothetical protein